MKVSPCLVFNGNSMEAIKHYEKAFDTHVTFLCQYKDTPPMEGLPPIPAEISELVMHSILPVGNSTIYLCDTTPDKPTAFGNGSIPCVELKTAEQVKTAYGILKKSGRVFCEAQETFWNKCYAEVEDKFGLKWMIMIEEVIGQ